MAAVNNDRDLLEKLSDLSKVEESSIVRALNKSKEQAEKDRKSAEDSYKDVQGQIEKKKKAKEKLEADIAKIKEILDEASFAPYEESLSVLGLSKSLNNVLEQLKKAPETVQSMVDELTALNQKEEEFDTARTEADIKVSEIDKSLPSVISDLQGMAAFLQSALSNETGNITKNEITGRLENINKNCPEAFSPSDMDRIAQLILFPDKLIEYFKAHQEKETGSKGVGEVIAAAMEEAAPVVEEETAVEDEMAKEMITVGLSIADIPEEQLQVMRESYKAGIIQTNLQILSANLIDFEIGMPAEVLVTESLNEKIKAILDKRKTLADIKSTMAVLLLPLETIQKADLTNVPLWTLTNPLALPTAQANEETLMNYGITMDEEDRKRYYPLMSTIPNQDFEDNIELLRNYGISIIKKNKKPAIRIMAQPVASLQSKIDALIEQGKMDEMISAPEVLAGEIEAKPLKASEIVEDDAVAKYEEAPANLELDKVDLEAQVKYGEIKNSLYDYVMVGQIEVDDYAYHINGQTFSRKRIERNLLRAVVGGVEDPNLVLKIAFGDGACTSKEVLQEVFDIMKINVQPNEGLAQGGVQ